jgi:hypothetical protein
MILSILLCPNKKGKVTHWRLSFLKIRTEG